MANGYIRISRDDLVAGENGVVYWKNGGRILGEVVSCIDSDDHVHYYLKTTNIKKAILIDAFVPVGVQDYNLFSDSANFINVQINEEDFSGDGGGNGISITFLLPEGKYYTCKYVEANGDIKIYDPAGDGGQIGGDSGLPDTSAASAGDVLALDSDKTPVWDSMKGIPDVENPVAFKDYVLDAAIDGFGNPTYKWKQIKEIRLTADGSNYINNDVTINDLYDYMPSFVYFDYLSVAALVFFDLVEYGTVMYPYTFIIKDRLTGNMYKWDDTYSTGLKFIPYTP